MVRRRILLTMKVIVPALLLLGWFLIRVVCVTTKNNDEQSEYFAEVVCDLATSPGEPSSYTNQIL
jgi:hypothetical protein